MHIRIVHLALVLLMACSAATSAGELLVNGGFESGQTGWSKWGTNAYIVSNPGYFQGSASAVTYWVDSGWVQTVPAGAGDNFTLSGEMIYPSSNPLSGRKAYLKIEFWNGSGSGATQLGYVEVGVMGPSDSANQWHSFSGNVTAPAGTAEARVVLLTYDIGTQGSGSGWAYFDNISLVAIPIPKGPDYNNDQSVDFEDLAYLTGAWLTVSPEYDLDGDNFIDMNDFAIFAQAWKNVIPDYPGYHLVWSDEFDGTSLNTSNWSYDIGNGCPSLCGWGNSELEYYRSQNVSVSGGHLIIEARAQTYGGSNSTSGKIHSENKQDFLYGKIEARIKLPKGAGMWPAFWMMPTDSVYGGWAASGEIDIMESANAMYIIGGTIHYGGAYPNDAYSGNTYSNGTDFSADYHIYSVEWEPTVMRWYVDGVLYSTKTSWWSSGGAYPAPFDQRFYIILNLAVGGNYTGVYNWQDVTTNLPQQMLVDWVRVYQKN